MGSGPPPPFPAAPSISAPRAISTASKMAAIDGSISVRFEQRRFRTGGQAEGFRRIGMTRIEGRNIGAKKALDVQMILPNAFHHALGHFVAAIIVVVRAVLKGQADLLRAKRQ